MPRKSNEKIKIIENIVESDNKLLSKPVKKSSKTKKDTKIVETSVVTTSKTEKNKTTSKVAQNKTSSKSAKNSKTTSELVKGETTSKPAKNSKTTSELVKSKTSSKSAKSESTSKSTKSQAKKTSATKKTIDKDVQEQHEISTINVIEYYDLPYKYNHTVIKLLAQTPNTLFVYWEISDTDVENYQKQYGENFFYITKPVLLVHNLTLNKTFEIEINDFANCWYITTQDTDCKFDIELGRKFIQSATNKVTSEHKHINDYMYITKSNDLQSPNDHILLEKLENVVNFKNVHTNETSVKKITSSNVINDIYKFYQQTYQEFYNNDNNNSEFLKNPSSKFNF